MTFSTGRDIVRFESVALPYTRKDPSNINWETFDKQNAAPNAEKLIYWRGIDLLSNISVDEQSYYRQKSQHGEKQNIPPTSLIQE